MGIEWRKVLEKVCERGEHALQFGDPERWVASEIYSVLAAQSSVTSQMPLPAEIPYGTNCPVIPSHKSKIADLCIEGESSYTWFELKVHHATWAGVEMSSKNMRDSWSSFSKDVGALLGLDVGETRALWERDKPYWYPDIPLPRAPNLEAHSHRFIAVYLQVNGPLDMVLWDDAPLQKRIRDWQLVRNCKQRFDLQIERVSLLNGEHAAVIVQWEQ